MRRQMSLRSARRSQSEATSPDLAGLQEIVKNEAVDREKIAFFARGVRRLMMN